MVGEFVGVGGSPVSVGVAVVGWGGGGGVVGWEDGVIRDSRAACVRRIATVAAAEVAKTSGVA